MLDFNWGMFWALLAALALRDGWQFLKGAYTKQPTNSPEDLDVEVPEIHFSTLVHTRKADLSPQDSSDPRAK
jgi:hypothetical protein